MKSFHIEVTVYRWLHKKHPQFACDMENMGNMEKFEKEFVSVVSAFVILIAFVTHIATLPVKLSIVWRTQTM